MMSTGFGFCPTCGAPRTAAEQKFCPECGSAFAAVAPPAPPAGEPTAPPPWATLPATPGGVTAQAAPQAALSYPPPYPGAPPAAPFPPAATSAGHKSRRPLLVLGGLVLVAIVGVFAYMNMSSTSGSISYSPSTVSCSSTASVTVTIRLPSSLHATDQITAQLDGQVKGTATLGSQFIQQSDGSWLQTTTQSGVTTCAGTNGQFTGTHVGRILDASGKVLADGSFTVTP